MSMPNSYAKENTNVHSKNDNESRTQDESQKCFLFSLRKYHSNKIIMVHVIINSLRNLIWSHIVSLNT